MENNFSRRKRRLYRLLKVGRAVLSAPGDALERRYDRSQTRPGAVRTPRPTYVGVPAFWPARLVLFLVMLNNASAAYLTEVGPSPLRFQRTLVMASLSALPA